MGTDIEKPVTKRDLEVALDHAITRMEKFVLDREIGMLWRFLLLGLALLGAQWAAISWVNYPRLKPFFMSMDLVPVNPSPQYPRTKPFRLEDVTRQQIEKIMAAHRSIHPQPKRDANGNVTDFEEYLESQERIIGYRPIRYGCKIAWRTIRRQIKGSYGPQTLRLSTNYWLYFPQKNGHGNLVNC
jgi:hypothetical protein